MRQRTTVRRRGRVVIGGMLCAAVLVAACGDDDDTATDTDTDTDTESPDGETASEDMTVLELTLGDDGLEGMPESFAGGAVEVSLTLGGDREYGSVDITEVEDGVTAEEFAEDIAPVFEGGPFPDYVGSSSGIETPAGETTTSTILVNPGPHVVWFEGIPESEDAPPPVEAILVDVTEGSTDELPETDGEITAVDYDFEVDLDGPGTVTFRNEGPDQFHHVILMDFGTNSADVVETALPELIASEGEGPPPDIEGFDMEQVNFEFAGSPVFGPGLAGTFEAPVEEGNTYAVICFIQDRQGGPPHAIGNEMYEVFTVGS